MRRCLALSLTLLLFIGGVLHAPDAEAVDVQFVAGVHGATFMPWDAIEDTGNGYGLTLGVNLDDWRLLGGFGGVLPKASLHGHFSVLWVETQWHPLQDALRSYGVPLWPYALVGVGLAMVDAHGSGEATLPLPNDAVRWVPDEMQPVAMAGLGFALGDFDAFSVSFDMRLYNDLYGGFVASAQYAF